MSYREVNEVARAIDADITVVSLEPTSLEGIFNTISTVGAMTDAEDEAVELVESLRTRLGIVETRVHERRKDGHEGPRVVGLEWLEPPFAVGHWVPEQIRRAGGWDLLGLDGEASRQTDWLSVVDVDPEMILLMPCGFHLAETVAEWERTPQSDRLEGDRGRPQRQRLRARRVRLLLASGPEGPRRHRDAGRDLRSRCVRRDLAAGQLDPAGVSQVPGSVGGPPATFDCLWCGTKWTTRSPGRSGGLGTALPGLSRPGGRQPVSPVPAARCADGSRGRGWRPAEVALPPSEAAPPARRPRRIATPGGLSTVDAEMIAYYEARAGEYDDWYLRRGRYARGPIHDAAWDAELDGAGTWLDGLPIRGEIVELAGGTGWWSPLLASKGELSIYDAAAAPLERARERLVAHRLRAHLHVRDAWAEPDRQVDALFFGFWLSHVPRDRTDAFLALARRWLKPDGILAFIDSLPDPQSGAADHRPARRRPCGPPPRRTVANSRSSRSSASRPNWRTRSRKAGFRGARVTTTGRFFLLGEARA